MILEPRKIKSVIRTLRQMVQTSIVREENRLQGVKYQRQVPGSESVSFSIKCGAGLGFFGAVRGPHQTGGCGWSQLSAFTAAVER